MTEAASSSGFRSAGPAATGFDRVINFPDSRARAAPDGSGCQGQSFRNRGSRQSLGPVPSNTLSLPHYGSRFLLSGRSFAAAAFAGVGEWSELWVPAGAGKLEATARDARCRGG